MHPLLMAASSILLLTTVAHSQPFAAHRPAHPAALILAGDEDSGDSSGAGDAGVTDNGAEGSSDSGDATAPDSGDKGSDNGGAGVTDNSGGDQSPDAAVAGATNDSAGVAPDGSPPSFATLGPLQGTVKNWVRAGADAR